MNIALSILNLRPGRIQKYTDLIRTIMLLILCWIVTPVYAASQPPKILSVKAPASADVGKLFEVEIKAQDDKALAYIEVNFGGKTSRILTLGKKSFSKRIKLKSIKSGRLTIKVTAVNKQKIKSKIYPKTISIRSSKKVVKTKTTKTAVASKSFTTSKQTSGEAKTATAKSAAGMIKLEPQNTGKPTNRVNIPTASMPARKVTQNTAPLKNKPQKLSKNPFPTKSANSNRPGSLATKTTIAKTKPAQLAILGMKPVKQKNNKVDQTKGFETKNYGKIAPIKSPKFGKLNLEGSTANAGEETNAKSSEDAFGMTVSMPSTVTGGEQAQVTVQLSRPPTGQLNVRPIIEPAGLMRTTTIWTFSADRTEKSFGITLDPTHKSTPATLRLEADGATSNTVVFQFKQLNDSSTGNDSRRVSVPTLVLPGGGSTTSDGTGTTNAQPTVVLPGGSSTTTDGTDTTNAQPKVQLTQVTPESHPQVKRRPRPRVLDRRRPD
jgi:hypothetical protein